MRGHKLEDPKYRRESYRKRCLLANRNLRVVRCRGQDSRARTDQTVDSARGKYLQARRLDQSTIASACLYPQANDLYTSKQC